MMIDAVQIHITLVLHGPCRRREAWRAGNCGHGLADQQETGALLLNFLVHMYECCTEWQVLLNYLLAYQCNRFPCFLSDIRVSSPLNTHLAAFAVQNPERTSCLTAPLCRHVQRTSQCCIQRQRAASTCVQPQRLTLSCGRGPADELAGFLNRQPLGRGEGLQRLPIVVPVAEGTVQGILLAIVHPVIHARLNRQKSQFHMSAVRRKAQAGMSDIAELACTRRPCMQPCSLSLPRKSSQQASHRVTEVCSSGRGRARTHADVREAGVLPGRRVWPTTGHVMTERSTCFVAR